MMLRQTARGDKLPSDWGFRLMALGFKVRDFLRPRRFILAEVGIKPGDRVLDFGCGPGSYVKAAAQLVGPRGRVYALDAHPLAIRSVRKMAAAGRISNVETILSDCRTGLPAESLNAVLLYDILHDLHDAGSILEEIHRILKPTGILSLSDHHLGNAQITTLITSGALFKPAACGKKTLSFCKK